MIVQVDKFCRGRPGVYAAATGSIRLESLFLTLSTRALTGRSSGTPTRYVKTAESCRKSRHSFWAIAACPFAGHQHHTARRVEADFGVLVVAPAARRDRSRDADPVEHAAPLRCALPLDRSTVTSKR